MVSRKLLLVFGLFFLFSSTSNAQSSIAIVLNEYSATNVSGLPGSAADIYGHTSDWVELYCGHTSPVSLASYYLSNDRNNLYKWKFPSGSSIGSNEYAIVWLSGKSGPIGSSANKEMHANFTLDQCKNQWLILSTDQGVVRDSVFVQKAKAGHTWGRVDYNTMGVTAWKLFTEASQGLSNPSVYSAAGYAPTPKCFVSTVTNYSGPNTGGFYSDGAQIAYFRLSDSQFAFDTAYSCFRIYYTRDGSYPDTTQPTTFLYRDSLNSPITIDQTTILRAVAYPNPDKTGCSMVDGVLPSFCETNTYFIDIEHNDFDPNFGVVSLAIDTSWFWNPGSTLPTTIHVEYYDKKKQVSEGYAVIKKPLQEAWITRQKGLEMTIDDERGFGCSFEGNIFNISGLGTTSRTVFPTLHLSGGDFESHSSVINTPREKSYGTGIRDVFFQSVAAKNNLHVNPLHIKPVVAFFNGKYQGVYNLREVYDKFYEAYYNKQPRDSLDLRYMHGTEGPMKDHEGVSSSYGANFRTEVYDPVMTGPINNKTIYDKVMTKLDQQSFIDYMILNSYSMNSDVFDYNVAFAKGADNTKPGGKWHYYLWNMPTIFNFTAVTMFSSPPGKTDQSPCAIYNEPIGPVLTLASNGHGNILNKLMNTRDNSGAANGKFQLAFKNRYQDLINGPLSCASLTKQFEFVKNLYLKEYKYHEDPGSAPLPGSFYSQVDLWDTLTTQLSRIIANRCYVVSEYFDTPNCFGTGGAKNITVDVLPAGAGVVKLNSIILDGYPWSGRYYPTLLSFKAIPTNTNYAFHHWEFRTHTPTLPASMDSTAISIIQDEWVVAVFTDKSKDLTSTGEGANIPTAFSPNGDGNNDVFKPVGAGEYSNEYEMTIWNRWGQEVFRSTSPDVGWDGNYKGQQAITGVYAFLITYKNVFGESKTAKGNVTLTR